MPLSIGSINMSSIPPNIIGSIFQAQLSAGEKAKEADAQRNKRTRDARELARLADQHTHEVEDTDHAENLHVHREDERQRDGQDARDTYEEHAKNTPEKLYSSNSTTNESKSSEIENEPNSEEPDPNEHIDLNA